MIVLESVHRTRRVKVVVVGVPPTGVIVTVWLPDLRAVSSQTARPTTVADRAHDVGLPSNVIVTGAVVGA